MHQNLQRPPSPAGGPPTFQQKTRPCGKSLPGTRRKFQPDFRYVNNPSGRRLLKAGLFRLPRRGEGQEFFPLLLEISLWITLWKVWITLRRRFLWKVLCQLKKRQRTPARPEANFRRSGMKRRNAAGRPRSPPPAAAPKKRRNLTKCSKKNAGFPAIIRGVFARRKQPGGKI